jgi:hypothetical protein
MIRCKFNWIPLEQWNPKIPTKQEKIPLPASRRPTFLELVHNNKTFQKLTKYLIAVIILKGILLALLDKMFRLLPVDGHDMNESLE